MADEGLACAKMVVGGVTTGVVFGVTTMVVGGVTSGVVFGGTVGVGGAKVSNFSPGKVVKLYPSQGAL